MSNRKVIPEEVSVVIQGPISDRFDECIKSLKDSLPGAEIIVATWRGGNNTPEGSVDKVIYLNPIDPLTDINGNRNNVERQMLSTSAGLQAASRPFVLKMRADHLLVSPIMLLNIPTDENKYTYLKSKIIVSSYFVRDHLKVPFLFHISDLIQFGRKEDMLSLWQYDPAGFSDIVLKSERKLRIFGNYCGPSNFREVPEQTLIIRWLNRLGCAVKINYPCDTSFRNFYIWENVLAHNFHIIDSAQSGIIYPDRFHKAFLGRDTLLSTKDLSVLQISPGRKKRYFLLLLNKYVISIFRLSHLLSTLNVYLSFFSPSLAKCLRHIYRSLKGVVHPDRV